MKLILTNVKIVFAKMGLRVLTDWVTSCVHALKDGWENIVMKMWMNVSLHYVHASMELCVRILTVVIIAPASLGIREETV